MQSRRFGQAMGLAAAVIFASALLYAANTVPTFIEQPGTQPGQAALEGPDRCGNCHGGYDPAVEPTHNWTGSMMAQATRDPIFWATMAIAEQDFVATPAAWSALMPGTTPDTGGAGDLCLRCHTAEGWLAGRSTPTDGSALRTGDFTGVSCDLCHRLVDPATPEGMALVDSDHRPYRVDPDSGAIEGFYGSGQYVIDPGSAKHGPYDNAEARHQFIASPFNRQGDHCGTCHDVSNPAGGALAPNSGRQDDTYLGPEAAFDYPPYAYGIVERTYSEWKASAWDTLRTSDFATLPDDLKTPGKAPEWASHFPDYNSSTAAGFNPPRTYSCQTCHMAAVTGQGCNKNPPVRTDLPLHDLTGGNTWIPEAMIWMSGQGTLRGGALPAAEVPMIRDGVGRARLTLRRAATVAAVPSQDGASLAVKVTNLTGHKLPSGYPEGRRIWVNVRFLDAQGALIGEIGHYDPVTAGLTRDTRIYEVHLGMARNWAQTLVQVGYDPQMPLAFNDDGTVLHTLGEIASGDAGEALETFHFVLNNRVLDDHRIPPYGLDPAEAARRNILPVPADAYPLRQDGTYQYWDTLDVPIPAGAAHADVTLFYQSTSREYVTFLRHANQSNADGENLYQAWLNTGMSAPEPLAAVGLDLEAPCTGAPGPVDDLTVWADTLLRMSWSGVAQASAYAVYRYRNPDLSDVPLKFTTATSALQQDVLGDGENWFYDVRAVNACGESPR